MVEMIFPDGTYVSSIVANLNVFTSNPGTSKGEGEIIYNSTTNKVYVNIGTTGSPNWYDISGSGEPTSHDLLDNLNWASAGHTFDAALNLNNNNLTSVAGLAFGSNPTISVPSGSTHYFKALTTNLLSLNTTTNTSYQPLAMNSQKITGLATPTTNGDAVRYEHLSADDHTQYLPIDGSRAMSENLTLLSKLIRGLASGALDSDAVNKGYIDDADEAALLLDGTRQMTGNLVFDKSLPTIEFDNLDEIRYNISTNTFSFVVGNGIMFQIDGTSLSANNNKITSLATPTEDTDAATKAYVDSIEGGWVGTATSDLNMDDYNVIGADTIQAKSTNSLTFKVSTGKSFVFQKV